MKKLRIHFSNKTINLHGSVFHRRAASIISAFCAVFLLSALVPCSVLAAPAEETGTDYDAQAEARREMTVESNEWENWPAGPAISAQSAILMDAETGAILYEKISMSSSILPASPRF